MFTKYFLNINNLVLTIVFVVKTASGQCTTDGCTVCNETELVCHGLSNVPSLNALDGVSTMEQRISLTNGTINDIPEGYFNLSKVVSIDLSNNRLTTLNMNSLEYATSLRTIDLTGNQIVCNRDIDWLQRWKSVHPANTVIGTCTDGENIEAYLSDKPGSLINVKIADSLLLDRTCDEISVPFIVIGYFTSSLEYRAYTVGTLSAADISIVNETITVPVGSNSSVIIIDITNRGENRDDVNTTLQIISKYPVSNGRQAQIQLKNGAVDCVGAEPFITKTTQTPSVSGSVTPPNGSVNITHKVPSESETTRPTSSEKKGSAVSAVVIIFAVIVFAFIVLVVAILLWWRSRKIEGWSTPSSSPEQ